MSHDPDSSYELVALYLAGALAPSQQKAFESHLNEDCGVCESQLREFSPVVESLISLVEPVAPSPELRSKLLQKIGGGHAEASRNGTHKRSSQQGTYAAPERQQPADKIFVAKADTAKWHDVGVPGVTTRVLYIDRRQKRLTALVRMEPGAVYPSHAHDEDEGCLVLEGELTCGELRLKAGDYQHIPARYLQAPATTREGCLLLVTSPLD